MTDTVFITGILGQDGAYLAQLALQQGYHVVGGVRRSSTINNWRLRELGVDQHVEIVDFELLETSNIVSALATSKPSHVFNLAAQSFVGTSFNQPLFTCDVDAMGVLRLLESIRAVDDTIRFYQASSSEMFGKVRTVPQNEETPFYPRSPYGVAKVFGHHITVNYREAYGLHASSGILFNHESPLRGEEFVTRKITSTLARIRLGKADILELGNLSAQRDWGHARDYVRGMWQMAQQPQGGDFVLATGTTSTIRQFIELAAARLGWSIAFEGAGEDEIGRDTRTGKILLRVNPAFYRPSEVDSLIGDASKAREQLNWVPEWDLERLVDDMVSADLRRAEAA